MQIRTRLTLLYTVITAALLLAFACIIYFSARENREKEFFALLKKEALTKANLYFNANVDPRILQEIYHSNREILHEVEVAIYDTDFNLLYHDAVEIDFVKETPEMIKKIYHDGEIRFYQDSWQVVGIKYVYEHTNYIITAAAYDQYGFNKLNSLLRSIVLVFIISVAFIYLAGRFFSKKAFDPVKEMAEKAKIISATNLDLRLKCNESKDELSELANTFNEMLGRLEKSFEAQKHFVFGISHALRTPLTAMIAELELTARKPRSIHEYQLAIRNTLSDAKKLVRLSNSLLDLAKADYDSAEISFKKVRIDEVLLDARREVLQAGADYKIDISFKENVCMQEDEIALNGNDYLLKTAFVNLMENACKFSFDKTCWVTIAIDHTGISSTDGKTRPSIILTFKDHGVGIPEHDLKNLFTPFYRGENKKWAEGNGIGLYLTQKIVRLHGGSMEVFSAVHEGTTFVIALRNRRHENKSSLRWNNTLPPR